MAQGKQAVFSRDEFKNFAGRVCCFVGAGCGEFCQAQIGSNHPQSRSSQGCHSASFGRN